MIHGSMTAANAQVEKALAEARDAGKFMVAVWMPDEAGNLICRRTTWQFPTERFAEAIGQLNQMLEEERNPPRGPLPLAGFLRKGRMNASRLFPSAEPDGNGDDEIQALASPVAGAPEDLIDPEDGE